jgi:hypothetical protein
MEEDVAWGVHKVHPCGTPNREDAWRSHPVHHDVQLVHPLRYHTLWSVPMDSSWKQGGEACAELTLMTPSKCWILLRYQILSNLGWVRFFLELVWILTRILIWKSLYISTGNWWWSVVPLISPWRWKATSSLWIYWRTTRLQEGSPKQVDVQEKNVRREDYKEPKISPCRDFFGVEYMKKGK